MKTEEQKLKAVLAMLIALAIGMTSCEQPEDEDATTVPDELTSISISFIAPDGTDQTFIGLDGGATELIRLKKNVEYQVLARVMSGTEDVTDAIKKEGGKYQLFLIDGGDAATTYRLQDVAGLAGVLNAGPAADCKLNIIFVEGLDKNSSVARGNVREGAGGTDKIFVQSDLIILD